jgi:putative transposase
MSPMNCIQRAYKVELDLNNQQITACRKQAGAARWAYNWGLRRKQEVYAQTGRSPSAMDLHRELNALKRTDAPWIYDVSKCAPQEALRNLDQAFAGFYRRCALKRDGKLHSHLGYPLFKSKQRGLGSFRLTEAIHVGAATIQLPRLGRLRLKERGYLPTHDAPISSATISEHAGHRYVSVRVEQERAIPVTSGPIVGVDLGVKVLATLSDEAVIANPKPLCQRMRKIKRLSRAVSRKQQGSKNRAKVARRLSREHRKVANQRANTLHQLTTRLARTKSVIVIEDLNVAGMLKNHHLAQAIVDVGFAEFRRRLTYKAVWYGSRVVVASRWEPSSRTCSTCGWVDAELTLADRVFHCQACGLVMDRDLNAAKNLEQLAGSSLESQNACGAASSDSTRESRVQLAALKQEPDSSRASV